MSKRKVKTYILQDSGQYEIMNDNHIMQEDIESNEEDVSCLHFNPFIQINKNVKYIDELYINNDGQMIILQDLLNTNQVSQKYKNKVLEKQLKNWQNEALSKIKLLLKGNRKKYERQFSDNFKIINSSNLFYIWLSLIIAFIMYINFLPFIIYNIFTKIFCIILILLAIISIIFSYVQKYKNNEFENLINENYTLRKKFYKKQKRKINKNFKKLYRYYIKLNKNNICPISKIVFDLKTYDYLLKLDKIIIQKNDKIKKENKGVNIMYHMPLVMSYILIISSSSYLIIMLLIYLLKLVFMKGE